MNEKADDKKRAVLIKGDANKPYEQAIFIVRGGSVLKRDAVSEAERIVNDYLRAIENGDPPPNHAETMKNPAAATTAPKRKRARRKAGTFDLVVSAAALIACVALFAILFYSNFVV